MITKAKVVTHHFKPLKKRIVRDYQDHVMQAHRGVATTVNGNTGSRREVRAIGTIETPADRGFKVKYVKSKLHPAVRVELAKRADDYIREKRNVEAVEERANEAAIREPVKSKPAIPDAWREDDVEVQLTQLERDEAYEAWLAKERAELAARRAAKLARV